MAPRSRPGWSTPLRNVIGVIRFVCGGIEGVVNGLEKSLLSLISGMISEDRFRAWAASSEIDYKYANPPISTDKGRDGSS